MGGDDAAIAAVQPEWMTRAQRRSWWESNAFAEEMRRLGAGEAVHWIVARAWKAAQLDGVVARPASRREWLASVADVGGVDGQ